MTREEHQRLICQKLSRRIAEVVPPGVGAWEGAGRRVSEPSDRFLDALDAFLRSNTPETRRDIHGAADELVRAWRLAGREWETRDRPPSKVRKEVIAP